MRFFLGLLFGCLFLLPALLLPWLGPVDGERGRETKTQTRVQATASAIIRLSSRARLGESPATGETGDPANRGIEAVTVALRDADALPFVDRPDDAIGDSDGDGRPEIVDAWGNPLAYFRADEYSGTILWIRMGEEPGGEVVPARPWKRPATGLFINPRTFQLFSAGADGVFNTDDDLGNWERSVGGTPVAPLDSPGSGAR